MLKLDEKTTNKALKLHEKGLNGVQIGKKLGIDSSNIYRKLETKGVNFIHHYPKGNFNLSETDKAYIAGIIDGDGCISIARSPQRHRPHTKFPYYQLRIVVAMTDKKTIDFLVGKTHGYYLFIKRKKPNKPVHLWQITTGVAENLLKQIKPYLITKAEHVKVALAFRKLKDARLRTCPLKQSNFNERTKLFQAMKHLNQRGQL